MAKQNSFLGFHRFGLKRAGLLQAELQLSFTTSYFTALLQGITNKSMIGQRRDDFLKEPFTVFLWGAKPSNCSELESLQVLAETIKSSWDCVESQRHWCSIQILRVLDRANRSKQLNCCIFTSRCLGADPDWTEGRATFANWLLFLCCPVSQVDEGGTPPFFMAGFFNIPFLFLWSWNVSCSYMKQTYLCMTQSRKSPKFWRLFRIFKYWLHRS